MLGKFGLGFLGIAESAGVDEAGIRKEIQSDIDGLIHDLDISGGLRMKMKSLHPKRVIVAKDGFKEQNIHNAIVLVEGNVRTGLIQNSIVIVIGELVANDIRGSVVATLGDIHAYHAGGRDQESLVMSRGQIDITAAYATTIVAEQGATIQSPTHLVAINTKVRSPHPTRIKYEFVRSNVLHGISGLLGAR